ncbi:MAG: hypothetical protein AAGI17_11445 [Planctomycetota bacterium]
MPLYRFDEYDSGASMATVYVIASTPESALSYAEKLTRPFENPREVQWWNIEDDERVHDAGDLSGDEASRMLLGF